MDREWENCAFRVEATMAGISENEIVSQTTFDGTIIFLDRRTIGSMVLDECLTRY
jgi:hypothetical protein